MRTNTSAARDLFEHPDQFELPQGFRYLPDVLSNHGADKRHSSGLLGGQVRERSRHHVPACVAHAGGLVGLNIGMGGRIWRLV
jgi:hypothetical protein